MHLFETDQNKVKFVSVYCYECEIWKLKFETQIIFVSDLVCVFFAGNSILVKSLTYILLANLDFLGKKYQNNHKQFSYEMLYLEVLISMNYCLFFFHLNTYLCLLFYWVLFWLFIKNGPMSLTKAIKMLHSYLHENTLHIFQTLTENDQQANKFSQDIKEFP